MSEYVRPEQISHVYNTSPLFRDIEKTDTEELQKQYDRIYILMTKLLGGVGSEEHMLLEKLLYIDSEIEKRSNQ